MIGGSDGDATLMSGSGTDIVIAGWTNYDSSSSDLTAIMNQWLVDVADLPIYLNAKTVHDHLGPGDTIVLGSFNDWVFWRIDGENKLKGVAEITTFI